LKKHDGKKMFLECTRQQEVRRFPLPGSHKEITLLVRLQITAGDLNRERQAKFGASWRV